MCFAGHCGDDIEGNTSPQDCTSAGWFGRGGVQQVLATGKAHNKQQQLQQHWPLIGDLLVFQIVEAALSGDVTDAQREALLQCLVACVLRGVLSSEDMVDLWLDVLVEHDTSSADAETVGTMLAVSGFCGAVFAPQPHACMCLAHRH